MQFKDIVGQDQAKRQLIQTVTENRVSHANSFFRQREVELCLWQLPMLNILTARTKRVQIAVEYVVPAVNMSD